MKKAANAFAAAWVRPDAAAGKTGGFSPGLTFSPVSGTSGGYPDAAIERDGLATAELPAIDPPEPLVEPGTAPEWLDDPADVATSAEDCGVATGPPKQPVRPHSSEPSNGAANPRRHTAQPHRIR